MRCHRNDRFWRYIADHHGAGADPSVAADADRAEDAASRREHDAVSDRGMALGALGVGPPAARSQSHVVVDHHVIADLGGLSYDRPHPVIDEEPAADRSPGVDLYAGQEPGRLRHDARQHGNVSPPQLVREAIRPDGPQALVENDFAGVPPAQSGILATCGSHILRDQFHDGVPLSGILVHEPDGKSLYRRIKRGFGPVIRVTSGIMARTRYHYTEFLITKR